MGLKLTHTAQTSMLSPTDAERLRSTWLHKCPHLSHPEIPPSLFWFGPLVSGVRAWGKPLSPALHCCLAGFATALCENQCLPGDADCFPICYKLKSWFSAIINKQDCFPFRQCKRTAVACYGRTVILVQAAPAATGLGCHRPSQGDDSSHSGLHPQIWSDTPLPSQLAPNSPFPTKRAYLASRTFR